MTKYNASIASWFFFHEEEIAERVETLGSEKKSAEALAKELVTGNRIHESQWQFDAEEWDNGEHDWKVGAYATVTVIATDVSDAHDKVHDLLIGSVTAPREYTVDIVPVTPTVDSDADVVWNAIAFNDENTDDPRLDPDIRLYVLHARESYNRLVEKAWLGVQNKQLRELIGLLLAEVNALTDAESQEQYDRAFPETDQRRKSELLALLNI